MTTLHQYNTMTEEIPEGFDEVIDAGYLLVADVTDPWGRRFEFRKEKKDDYLVWLVTGSIG